MSKLRCPSIGGSGRHTAPQPRRCTNFSLRRSFSQPFPSSCALHAASLFQTRSSNSSTQPNPGSKVETTFAVHSVLRWSSLLWTDLTTYLPVDPGLHQRAATTCSVDAQPASFCPAAILHHHHLIHAHTRPWPRQNQSTRPALTQYNTTHHDATRHRYRMTTSCCCRHSVNSEISLRFPRVRLAKRRHHCGAEW